MDVKEFVSDVLTQVSAAMLDNEAVLRAPHKESKNADVSYVYERRPEGDFEGWSTVVEFNIAVTTAAESEGVAKLRIPAVGELGGDQSTSQETVSRVAFKVPIQILRPRIR